MHPLLPILRAASLHVDLIVRHTGESDDVESVRLSLNPHDDSIIEPSDGLYISHERQADSDLAIIRRINRGELSGTHVFPDDSGFAHWHIELRGQITTP